MNALRKAKLYFELVLIDDFSLQEAWGLVACRLILTDIMSDSGSTPPQGWIRVDKGRSTHFTSTRSRRLPCQSTKRCGPEVWQMTLNWMSSMNHKARPTVYLALCRSWAALPQNQDEGFAAPSKVLWQSSTYISVTEWRFLAAKARSTTFASSTRSSSKDGGASWTPLRNLP